MFIGPDALAETVAKEEGIEKRDLLMTVGVASLKMFTRKLFIGFDYVYLKIIYWTV